MVNRVKRRVSCLPKATYYKPREVPLCDLEIINLSIEELEAIRLCDLLKVEQNEAADLMGVSRKTFWNDLQKARQKVVDALVNGKAIEISGGEYVNSGECRVEFHCKGCEHSWELQCNTERPTSCPKCGSEIFYRIGGDGRGKRFIKNDYCCPKTRGKAADAKEGSVEMTKIAIPSMSENGLESDVCYHYGSCEYFTIVDVHNKDVKSVEAISNLSPEGEHNCTAPSIILKSHNVDAVLVAGIGGRPLMSLAEKNIKVFAGIMGKVSNAVQDYNNGLLQELTTNGTCKCSHH